ncbi:tetratricopeptide repeat protein [Magnetospirillum sp. SS-4]|uniref:O-linked N-acetylglucosamine transferase, SPINDLY family protein n=1 Tax=Magnetospirillum sp. SS-4 TaxID=2681465 RepID=UPI00138400DC|nr:tetratricopeptide repeat protein [Magnetospirillum sp. SS-4]CAA7616751.1 conserved hypothetical protein [Magnetospirillum sp. SS-4]
MEADTDAPRFEQALRLHGAGRLAEAEAALRAILSSNPGHADCLDLLGIIAFQTGHAEAAIDLLGQAIGHDGQSHSHHTNLGNILRALGHPDRAESCYRHALALRPDCGQTLCNLGITLRDLGRLSDAEDCCRRAILHQPELADAHLTLASVLRGLGRPQEARPACERGLELAPGRIEGWINLGNILQDLGRLDDAIALYRQVLAQHPDRAEIHNNLATALGDLGHVGEAAECYERAIMLKPDFAEAHSNLVVTLPFLSGVAEETVLAAARRAGAALEAPFLSIRPIRHSNVPDAGRRLRIGYLSPSLHSHVLAPYVEPVLAAHHRDRVSVHVYAHVPNPDSVTWRMRDLVESWTFIHEMNDDQVAARVVADGIDILVDPMGHWAGNRLGVFARKPAPVQVSYLCQGLTTGLAAMDYVIADPWLNRDGAMRELAVETVIELPSGFQVTSFPTAPDIGEPPVLTNGHVTFGSFNNPSKISDATIGLWARVLAATPDSRLLVKGRNLDRPGNRRDLLARLHERGLPPDRVEVLGWLAADNHLSAHDRMDIMLDTTPFTGGRTTLEALWMGVPAVTLVGRAAYGRFSYSHLCRAGAPELAANSPDGYVAIATALARDHDRLRHYRRSLRPAIRASSLLDADLHASELEAAFREMWREWCISLPEPA